MVYNSVSMSCQRGQSYKDRRQIRFGKPGAGDQGELECKGLKGDLWLGCCFFFIYFMFIGGFPWVSGSLELQLQIVASCLVGAGN